MLPTPEQGLLYLWDRRTLYLDQLKEPLQLSQAAATLAVSLNGPMHVHVKATGRHHACHSLLLAAGTPVEVDTSTATVATCYLDVYGEDFAALKTRAQDSTGRIYRRLKDDAQAQQVFARLLDEKSPPDEAYARLSQFIGLPPRGAVVIDPRIVRVIALIKSAPNDNHPIEQLATAVNLSVPRLVQLFKQQIGVPIRRYRQWHRLYVTAVRVARGCSLTEAALQAGFTDSSHFSHTFRSILGMKPSVILSQMHRIRLYAPASLAEDASIITPPVSVPK